MVFVNLGFFLVDLLAFNPRLSSVHLIVLVEAVEHVLLSYSEDLSQLQTCYLKKPVEYQLKNIRPMAL